MIYKKDSLFKKIRNFLGISLILSLLFFQVFQVNDLIKKLYLIRNYKKNMSELLEENKLLKLDLLQNGSLKKLEEFAEKFNFEKVKEIKYIQIGKDTFVLK